MASQPGVGADFRTSFGGLITSSQFRVLKSDRRLHIIFPPSDQSIFDIINDVYRHDDFCLVVENFENAESLVHSGILSDLRYLKIDKDFEKHESFSNMYRSRFEYYAACNELRDKIAKSTVGYRWCGGELESIVNLNIIANANYVCGLGKLGIYTDTQENVL